MRSPASAGARSSRAASRSRPPRRDGEVADRVEGVRRLLLARYRALAEALARVDRDLLRPLPCNSGCFSLVELAPGLELSAERVRRHLLDEHETGLVAVGERFLRIAFCSVREDDLAEVVGRLERGVAQLAG